MLTLYKAPRAKSKDSASSTGSSSSNSSISEIVIPAGRPYLTKVNGKLCLAREKRDKTAEVAIDLLGHVFGTDVRVIRKTKSISSPPTPLLLDGVQYVPQVQQQQQQQQVSYTPTALHSQPMCTPGILPVPLQTPYQPLLQFAHLQQPQAYYVPQPTAQDLEQLKQINSYINQTQMDSKRAIGEKNCNGEMIPKTTITITKHVCGNCGRLRSRKYHHEHPIKDGENPIPTFCRKCQKDASSTSEEEKHPSKSKKANKKTFKYKKHKYVETSSESETTVVHESDRNTSARSKKLLKHSKSRFKIEKIDSDQRDRGRSKHRRVPSEGPLIKEYHQAHHHHTESAVSRRSKKALSPSTSNYGHYKESIPASRKRRARKRYTKQLLHSDDILPPHPLPREEVVKLRYPRKIPSPFVDENTRTSDDVTSSSVSDFDSRSHDVLHDEKSGKGRKGFSRRVADGAETQDGTHYQRDSKKPGSRPTGSYIRRRPAAENVDDEKMFDQRQPGEPRYAENLIYQREHPLTERNSDHQDSNDSSQPPYRKKSARRREERRTFGDPTVRQPWAQPHIIRPESNDDKIVVTERYVYRPRAMNAHTLHNDELEHDRQIQKELDSIMLNTEMKNFRELNEDALTKAAKHYTADWSNHASESVTSNAPSLESRQRTRGRYRRDRYPDSDVTEEEVLYQRDEDILPPAPTPPTSHLTPGAHRYYRQKHEEPPYPVSLNQHIHHHEHTHHSQSVSPARRPPRSRNIKESETTHSLSRRHLREEVREGYTEDDDSYDSCIESESEFSDRVERERQAEREAESKTEKMVESLIEKGVEMAVDKFVGSQKYGDGKMTKGLEKGVEIVVDKLTGGQEGERKRLVKKGIYMGVETAIEKLVGDEHEHGHGPLNDRIVKKGLDVVIDKLVGGQMDRQQTERWGERENRGGSRGRIGEARDWDRGWGENEAGNGDTWETGNKRGKEREKHVSFVEDTTHRSVGIDHSEDRSGGPAW